MFTKYPLTLALCAFSGQLLAAADPQPAPRDRTPSVTCQTNHSSPYRTVTKDGRSQTIRYKSSNEVNYLQPGWEGQISADWQFFDGADLGESNRDLQLLVIDVRTVNGVPHYHYFSNSSNSRNVHDQSYENWSSTKTLGAALAFHRLRTDSQGKIGATATIAGNLSIAKDMDVLNQYSSNELGGYYKALGGRKQATDMIWHWLHRQPETFGGFYGDSTWGHAASHKFTNPYNYSQYFTLEHDEYTGNSLSILTMTEMLKRFGVGYRDVHLLPKRLDYSVRPSPSQVRNAPASIQNEDLQVLFYGSFPSSYIGGMMWDGLRDVPAKHRWFLPS